MSRSLFACMTLALLLVGACADRNDSDPAHHDATQPAPVAATNDQAVGLAASADDDTAEPLPITWVACAEFLPAPIAILLPDYIHCGRIQAPLDFQQPAGEQIDVRFAVARAENSSTEVVAVHLGGPDPNFNNLTLFTWCANNFLVRDLHPLFNLLFVESRGAATSSTPLVCPKEMWGQFYFGKKMFRNLVVQCLDSLAPENNPAFMSTIDSARDLDLVRQALGVDQLRLFGNSYGSRLMLEYLRLFGANVSAYLLDSVFPPQTTGQHDLDRILKTLAADCDADPACPLSGQKVWQDTGALLEHLDGRPDSDGIIWPDSRDLTRDLFHLGLAPDVLAQWPAVLADLENGNNLALSQWHQTARNAGWLRKELPKNPYRFNFDPYSDNVLCIDHPDWMLYSDRDFLLWRLFPPYVPLEQEEWMSRISCDELGRRWARTPEVNHEPVASDAPGLMISPRLDQNTPWTDAVDSIERGLSAATMVPVNADHAVLVKLGTLESALSAEDQACLRQVATDWLLDPFDPYSRECIQEIARPLSFNGP